MIFRSVKLVILALFIAVPFALGQRVGQERNNRRDRGAVDGMIGAYVISKLQDSLDLSDEQFAEMVVAQKNLQTVRHEYRRERSGLLREMRQVLRRDDASDDDLKSLLDNLDSIALAFRENEKLRYDQIDDILNVRQRLRYRVLESELHRRLEEMMRQTRRNVPERRRRP